MDILFRDLEVTAITTKDNQDARFLQFRDLAPSPIGRRSSITVTYADGHTETDYFRNGEVTEGYYEGKSVKTATISEGIVYFGHSAFENCKQLEVIDFGDSRTTIPQLGGRVFYDSTDGLKIVVPDALYDEWIAKRDWTENLDNITDVVVKYSIYYRQTPKVTLTFKDGTTRVDEFEDGIIPASKYKGVTTITNVEIGEGVTSIGNSAFQNCTSLTSVEIPNSVTSIGNSAFSYCSMLTSVTIPNSVTSIGTYTFQNCTSLTSVEIPNSVTSIGISAFNGCKSLTSVTIPNSVTSISNNTFFNCSGLASIEIPNSVTSIGNNTFQNCTSLTSVEIPNSVTSIGISAFKGCSSLSSIKMSAKVSGLNASTFEGCTSLQVVDFGNERTTVPTVNQSAFTDTPDTKKIVVPDALYENWKVKTNWDVMADSIIKYSDYYN